MDQFKNINLEKLQICLERIVFEKASEDLINFLQKRPWYQPIHTQFQKFLDENVPGSCVVAMNDDESAEALTKINEIFSPVIGNKIVMVEMVPSQCHNNCAFLHHKYPRFKLYYGWVLSDCGRWRNHSWLINQDGNIIETTEERHIYIGYQT